MPTQFVPSIRDSEAVIVTFNESHLREARNFGVEVIRPAEALRRIQK